MTSSPASQENMDGPPSDTSGALANIIELARLSPLTLLYCGAAASAADAGREQAAALASAAKTDAAGEVVVLFDAGSDVPVPDLLADIETAVLEAAPQAPLAPPMAGPVEALAFWQQALGLRFLLIMHRFELALSRPDPEFDEVLLKLVHDPIDISVLLVMDEAAAPLLQRLRDALPELGETFLRLPEPAAMLSQPKERPSIEMPTPVPEPVPTPRGANPAPAAQFGPAPFLFDDPDDGPADQAMQVEEEERALDQPAPGQGEQPEEQRRSRHFSSLLEQAGIAPDAFSPPAEKPSEPFMPPPAELTPLAPPADRIPQTVHHEIYPAAPPEAVAAAVLPLPDGRAEPSFHAVPAAAPAASAATARVYRERRPMQVAAWMQKRRSRRRRGTMNIASRVGNSSTVLFFLLMTLAVLGWQMPQLAPSAGTLPRGAAAQPRPVQRPQNAALRLNRYRLSISSAAWLAGTGRDTR